MNQNSAEDPPLSVTLAERLLWISAAITMLLTIVAYIGLLPFRNSGGTVISNLTTIAFLVLCATKIKAGRNWARWLMLAVFLLGSLMLPLALVFSLAALSLPGFLVVVGMFQFVIQLSALVLVIIPASGVWFRPSANVTQ